MPFSKRGGKWIKDWKWGRRCNLPKMEQFNLQGIQPGHFQQATSKLRHLHLNSTCDHFSKIKISKRQSLVPRRPVCSPGTNSCVIQCEDLRSKVKICCYSLILLWKNLHRMGTADNTNVSYTSQFWNSFSISFKFFTAHKQQLLSWL